MGTHERGETKYSKIKHRTMNDRIKSVVVVILSVHFIYIFFFWQTNSVESMANHGINSKIPVNCAIIGRLML